MILKLDYDPYDPLPMLESEDVERYLKVEESYMAAKGYARRLDAKNHRERAVLLISKYSKCENFDPVIPYLAMNYFDRYISRTAVLELSRDRLHDVDIIALSCLILAWKMRDFNFKTRKFLAERPDLAEVLPLELRERETEIVDVLNWRMRSLMAFCYVPYFAPMFHSTYGFSRRTINQIIIQIQDVIGMAHYRPSVIAASALLSACYYLYSELYQTFFHRITSLSYFQRYRNHIELCVDGMISMCNNLQLIIQSAMPEKESSQVRQVRAGWTDEGASTSSMKVTNITNLDEQIDDSQFGFPLRWSVEGINEDDFVIFKPLPTEAVTEAEPGIVPGPAPATAPAQVAPRVEVGPKHGAPNKPCCNLL